MEDRQTEIPHGPKELIRKHRIDSWIVKWKQEWALNKASPPALLWITALSQFWLPAPFTTFTPHRPSPAFLNLCPSIRMTNQLCGSGCVSCYSIWAQEGKKNIHVRRTFLSILTPANSCCLETYLIKKKTHCISSKYKHQVHGCGVVNCIKNKIVVVRQKYVWM